MPAKKRQSAGGQVGGADVHNDGNGGHLGQEFVSLDTVKEMLSVQESLLRSIFDSAINSLNSRLDDVMRSVFSVQVLSTPKRI